MPQKHFTATWMWRKASCFIISKWTSPSDTWWQEVCQVLSVQQVWRWCQLSRKFTDWILDVELGELPMPIVEWTLMVVCKPLFSDEKHDISVQYNEQWWNIRKSVIWSWDSELVGIQPLADMNAGSFSESEVIYVTVDFAAINSIYEADGDLCGTEIGSRLMIDLSIVIVWRSCVSFVLYCNQRQIEYLVATVLIKSESILVIVSTLNCYFLVINWQ